MRERCHLGFVNSAAPGSGASPRRRQIDSTAGRADSGLRRVRYCASCDTTGNSCRDSGNGRFPINELGVRRTVHSRISASLIYQPTRVPPLRRIIPKSAIYRSFEQHFRQHSTLRRSILRIVELTRDFAGSTVAGVRWLKTRL